jgi:hypothetical protein
MDQIVSTEKVTWQYGERRAKANFQIPLVGKLSLEVEVQLPGGGVKETADERKELALRHARMLVRLLANSLERETALAETPASSLDDHKPDP